LSHGNNGAGAQAFSEQTITIKVRTANQAPVLQPIGNRTATENQLFQLQLQATDADGDGLTYSASPLPPGATFTPATGEFRWTPNFFQSGTFSDITFTVSDGNKSQTEIIGITVANVNRAPSVIPMIQQSGREDALLSFTIAAADVDNDSIALSTLTSLPEGAHFDGKTGEFEWKPNFNQAGTYTFTIQASDPNGATGTTDVVVRIDNVNRPPLLNLGNHQILLGQEAVYSLAGTDPDLGTTLTYTVTPLPPGATFTPATGLFRWTPGAGQAGDYLMLVTVSDGLTTTFEPFTLRADTQLQQPHVQIELTPSFPVVPGQKVIVNLLADGFAEIANISATVDGVPVVFDASRFTSNASRVFTMTAGGPGRMVIRATATDADGLTSATDTILKIKNPDDTTAPIIAFDGSVNGGVIAATSAIRATILDTDLDHWTLEIAHAGSDTFVLLASGATPLPPTPVSLTQIDPSGFSNGFYRLKLTAEDVAGRRAVTEAIVEVRSAVKTQQFTRTETDLTVTLDGHVFNLVRQYDSLNASMVNRHSGTDGDWPIAMSILKLTLHASRTTLHRQSSAPEPGSISRCRPASASATPSPRCNRPSTASRSTLPLLPLTPHP